MKSLTVSRKFMEILNLSEQKDSYHTIKDLEVKLTFQETESDNCTPSRIRLMQNEPFVEILSYCVVRVPYILLRKSYYSQDTRYAVFEIGVKKITRKIYLWNLNHLPKKRAQIAKKLSRIDVKSGGSRIFNKLALG